MVQGRQDALRTAVQCLEHDSNASVRSEASFSLLCAARQGWSRMVYGPKRQDGKDAGEEGEEGEGEEGRGGRRGGDSEEGEFPCGQKVAREWERTIVERLKDDEPDVRAASAEMMGKMKMT